MSDIFLKNLTELLVDAIKKSLDELFKTGKTFYYITASITGEGFTPCLSASCEEDFKQTDFTIDKDIRFSEANSTHYAIGYKTNFNEVTKLLNTRPTIDDLSLDDWQVEWDMRMSALVDALIKLDREGMFSKTQPRQNILVTAECLPSDDSDIERAKLLNSPDNLILKEWLES